MNGIKYPFPSIVREKYNLNGIQYLRGVAAMMVVFHHAPHNINGLLHETNFGARGVDIFFVISGFIMAYTTADSDKNKWTHARSFFAKRLIRIAPLYWIALSYMAMPMVLNHGPNLDLLKDYLFVPHYSQRYPGEIYPILVPGWSLNYEMFFYLLFGLSIFAGRYKLLLVLISMTGLLIAGYFIESVNAPVRFYTSSDLMGFVFGIGVYIFYSKTPRRNWSFGFIPLVVIASFAVLAFETSGYGPLVHAIPAAIIVYSAVISFEKYQCRLLEILGAASYSIYLFHASSLPISSTLVNFLGLSVNSYSQALAILMLYLIVGCSIGVIMHYIVERPTLRWLTEKFARGVTPNEPSVYSPRCQ